jgi:hypothetical protein
MAFDPVPVSAAAPSADDDYASKILQVPFIAEVKQGSLAAVYAPAAMLGADAGEVVARLQSALPRAGLGLAEAPKSAAFVVYNPQMVSPEEIAQADEAGQLDSIAAPIQSGQGAAGQAPVQDVVPNDTPSPTANVIAANSPASTALAPIRAAATNPVPASQRAMPSQGILDGLTKRAV